MSSVRWVVLVGVGVAGLVVVCAGALIVVVALGGRPSFASFDSRITALARHRYWEVPVTPAQIDDLVRQIEALDGGSVVLVDEQFVVRVLKGNDASMHRLWVRDLGTGRVVTIDMRVFGARPAREQIMKRLACELDREEFRPKQKEEPSREVSVP